MGDEVITKRWEDYFCNLLNEGAGEDDIESDMGTGEGEAGSITLEEVERALKKMRNGKVVGPDGVPVEVWKIGGRKASEWLHYSIRCLVGRVCQKNGE